LSGLLSLSILPTDCANISWIAIGHFAILNNNQILLHNG
jgi:hypothetical protein